MSSAFEFVEGQGFTAHMIKTGNSSTFSSIPVKTATSDRCFSV